MCNLNEGKSFKEPHTAQYGEMLIWTLSAAAIVSEVSMDIFFFLHFLFFIFIQADPAMKNKTTK